MSDRPNAVDVMYESWFDCGEIGKCQVEALRDAVGATEGQPVVLLGDGTLSVAVQQCDSCGDDAHEPNEDCWAVDYRTCDYYRGVGTCSFGCRVEPECHTGGPWGPSLFRIPGAES